MDKGPCMICGEEISVDEPHTREGNKYAHQKCVSDSGFWKKKSS